MERRKVIVKGETIYVKGETLDLISKGINNISEIEGLESLTNLQELTLSENKITEIKGLEALTNLIILTLSENKISEIKGLESLTKLQEISLNMNKISEIKGLEALKNLQKLNLEWNQITEIKGLESLIKLQEISLDENQITEIKGLESLIKLRDLSLDENQITEIKGLESLIKLRDLYLDENQITEIKGLESLINLQDLYLDGNQITEIKGLEPLTNLIMLFLSENKISEIKGLESLIRLQTLFLDGNQITEIKDLESLTNLQVLRLDGNQITEIKGLMALSKLKDLLLNGNKISEIKGLMALSKLQYLLLNGNKISEIKGLESLIRLQTLFLETNQITEIKGLESLIRLKRLILERNQITEIKGLEALKNLQDLCLDENKISEIKGLESLTSLQALSLENNPITNSKEFIKLLSFKNIKTIEIDYHNLQIINKEDIESIRKFLLNSYDWIDGKRVKSLIWMWDRKKNLDKMIGITNILINLYPENWKEKSKFHVNLKELMEERSSLEKDDTPEYYQIQALKNVFYAGMGRDRSEQLKYLEQAIKFFEKAEKPRCLFFYKIYALLLRSVLASAESKFEESKEYVEDIIKLLAEQKHIKLHPSLQKLLDILPEFQDKFIDYAKFPKRWEQELKECSKRCYTVIREECPQLQYSKPAVHRILYHVVDDMRYSKDEVSSHILERQSRAQIINESKQEILRLSRRLGKKKDDIVKWLDNFRTNEQRYARKLLEHLKVVSVDELEEDCQEIYKKILEEYKLEDLIFVGIGGEAKSDKHILYHFRLYNKIPEAQFFNKLDPELNEIRRKVIVYQDDIASTGNQMCLDWKDFKSRLPTDFFEQNTFIFAPLYLTEAAKLKIQEETDFTVIYIEEHLLTEENNVFSKEATVFKKSELETAKEICWRYGKKLYSIGPLGYGNSGLLLVFPYNTPNNTLPVIWGESKDVNFKWVPLFHRWESRKVKKK